MRRSPLIVNNITVIIYMIQWYVLKWYNPLYRPNYSANILYCKYTILHYTILYYTILYYTKHYSDNTHDTMGCSAVMQWSVGEMIPLDDTMVCSWDDTPHHHTTTQIADMCPVMVTDSLNISYCVIRMGWSSTTDSVLDFCVCPVLIPMVWRNKISYYSSVCHRLFTRWDLSDLW